MPQKIPIRCGRIRNIFIAMAAPSTTIIPFIYFKDLAGPLKEWQVWVSIFVFLGIIISISVWLSIQAWPKAEFSKDNNNIRISYKSSGPFTPGDFSFSLADMSSFKRKVIFDLIYFELKLGIFSRVIHIGPPNYSLDELTEFYEFFFQLEED